MIPLTYVMTFINMHVEIGKKNILQKQTLKYKYSQLGFPYV